jgi:hypothetical protein
MNDIFSRALKIALRTGDKVIVIDPSQPKPYIMLDLDDYETLLENKISEPQNESEMQKQVLAETVKVNIANKKKKSVFETKISEMAGAGESFRREETKESATLPRTEMEVEERFFLEQNA